jgi:RNA polymerase sigma-70 factor (ECF subfamily)
MDDDALTQLIQGAQRGEPEAFEGLVDLFANRLHGFLIRMTGSRTDAEDLTQEVFVRLVRRIADYQHDGRFEPWLFRIAANLARDRLRRLKRTPKHVAGPLGDEEADDFGESRQAMGDEAVPDASAAMSLLEDVDALNAALARLPEAEREVIMLRHFSEMSFREIAELTGTPLGTALARAHRGLAKLREMMTAGNRQEDAA